MTESRPRERHESSRQPQLIIDLSASGLRFDLLVGICAPLILRYTCHREALHVVCGGVRGWDGRSRGKVVAMGRVIAACGLEAHLQ